MRGDGTKLDITTNNPPPARLLDLTRLVSRAGLHFTGVDRVERAYLGALLSGDVPCFGLVRTALGYVLLDADGMHGLAARLDGEMPWGAADRLSRISRKLSDNQRRAQSDLRRIALDRVRPRGLQKMLARHLPKGAAYLNVGHSNFTDRVVNAVRYGFDGKIAVLVHDTIPLDFPDLQRPESVPRFAGFLRRVGHWADLVICNSAQTEQDVQRHLETDVTTVVAHLGVEVPMPGVLPDGVRPTRPYFVTLGTIEPRKNHGFLLDVWEDLAREMGEDAPELVICGKRGWRNEDVFARLDAGVARVTEHGGLGDGAIATLLEGAQAAVFPSIAEGFGLPPLEAAALGVPVICCDLAITREVLGDIPVYVDVNDRYSWVRTIKDSVVRDRADQDKDTGFQPPTWAAHFKTVLSLT